MSASSHDENLAKLLSNLQKVDVSPGTAAPKSLEEMDMTPAEIERLGNCMKDPKFMELFQEYADEISDPRLVNPSQRNRFCLNNMSQAPQGV